MTNEATHTSGVRRSSLDLDAELEGCGRSFDEIRGRVLACRRRARRALDERLQRALSGRGLEVEHACATELAASLADLSVCELLQVISLGRRDAIIEVSHGALTSHIWCSAGEVVDAVSGRLKGEVAAHRIVALAQGEVVVDFRPVRRPRAIAVSTHALLMEALRRKDECALLESRLGGKDCVYRSAPVAPRAELHGLERALLDALEAGARVGSVLACCSVDDLTVLQAMARLVERGWLVPAHDARSSRVPHARALDVPPASGARRLPRSRIVAWLAGGVVLLGAGLAAIRWQCAGAAPAQAAPSARVSAPPARAPGAPRPPSAEPTRLVVHPSSAEIWLDGRRVATGVPSVALQRDGRTHELRISAPDHVTQVLLFRDVPPPCAVVLAARPPAAGAGS